MNRQPTMASTAAEAIPSLPNGLMVSRMAQAIRRSLICRMANQIRLFGLRQINPTGKSLLISEIVSSPESKIFFVFVLPKSLLIQRSRPTRGAIARRHERGADAVDVKASGAQRQSQAR